MTRIVTAWPACIYRVGIALLLWAVLALPSRSQSAAGSGAAAEAPIDFDVVSIHPSKNPDASMAHSWPANGDSMSFTNIPVLMLIFYVYSGDHAGLTKGLPAWVQTQRYDITVKVTGRNVEVYSKLSQDQRKQMLRRVLEDRFKLQSHHESQLKPVYDLVVAKGGLKLADAVPADIPANGKTVFYTGVGQLSGRGARVGDLATVLSDTGPGRSDSSLGREVIDKTGLTGRYNFTLRFAFEADAASPGASSPASSDAPSIFSAIQDQLGLKLEPSNAPVDILVIDHIEKPAEN